MTCQATPLPTIQIRPDLVDLDAVAERWPWLRAGPSQARVPPAHST